uniref:Putative secreted peptide n=1 Tax=Anopheles braziliensis TaxID=58242 RepID=A0A2M3ZV54_9DIPT
MQTSGGLEFACILQLMVFVLHGAIVEAIQLGSLLLLDAIHGYKLRLRRLKATRKAPFPVPLQYIVGTALFPILIEFFDF